MATERRKKRGTAIYSKLALAILLSLFIFVTVRGLSSYLNQEKMKLEKEAHSLASSNEWIKYEINDRISLDKVEKIAREKLQMTEAKKEDAIVVEVKSEDLNPPAPEPVKEPTFIENIQKAIGDFFNGK